MSKAKMEIKIVEKDPKTLKFDPNQPRKKFDKEAIENLAKTYDSQGVINPPEIDENDIVITGEIRVKSAVLKKLDRIPCKLLIGLSDHEKFERQTIENLHHNSLNSKEKGEAIIKLWKSKMYKDRTELAEKLGISFNTVKNYVKLPKLKEELGLTATQQLEDSTIIAISESTKDKNDRQKLAKKAIEEKLRRDDVREVARTIKKVPREVKEIIFKPKPEITIREQIKQVEEIAELPKDIQNEVIKEEITINDAKVIAEIPSEPLRKKEIAERKIIKKRLETEVQKKKDLAEGKTLPKPKYFDKDANIISNFRNTCQKAMSEMTYARLETYGDFARKECIKMMKVLFEHLRKELKKAGEVAPGKVIELDDN